MQSDPLTTFFKILAAIEDDPNDHRHSFMGPMMAFPVYSQSVKQLRIEDGKTVETSGHKLVSAGRVSG